MSNYWNEAIAYGYLSDIGCQNIKFIPRSRENGHKTPDIMGYLDGQEIICEAKRVNRSDAEIKRRQDFSVGSGYPNVSAELLAKIRNICKCAGSQISSYAKGRIVHRLVFLGIEFDDSVGDEAEQHAQQIETYLQQCDFGDLNIVFRVDTLMYSEVIRVKSAISKTISDEVSCGP
ncbi:hypothetical protein JL100_013370 [Skermanella mucosa]|uniref:hypothetical protein n=1 Tax=Skermanella mucosa TaxID=1789672 RepID=UPI001E5B20B5|nr:hypothetical protein [Skermanella mucosa]UEM23680.1 hypothetical protein JL100_013370 [Skermanella mucosa]